MSSNQPRRTKTQRREAARLKAKELREASARRERRNMVARRGFIGVIGLGVTGGLGCLVCRDVKIKSDTKDNKSPSKFPAPSEGLAATKASQSGIPRQILSDAFWTYGEGPALDTIAASAPVLDIYFDYSYSRCAQLGSLHTQEINQLLSEKKITLALHPYKLLEQEWTGAIMNAVGMVLDEAPAQPLNFHSATFGISSQTIQTKNQSSMMVEGLVAVTTKVNVPKDVSGKFRTAVDSDKYDKWVKPDDEAFKARELEGTPAVSFKGKGIDLSKLQAPTSLTELVAAATPTT